MSKMQANDTQLRQRTLSFGLALGGLVRESPLESAVSAARAAAAAAERTTGGLKFGGVGA